MTYDVSYKNLPREEADKKAIEDIKRYLRSEGWVNILEILLEESTKPEFTFQTVNVALGWVGVRGYPVHAFGRRFMLGKYREWMHSDPNPVMTDEQGFSLPEEK